MPVMLLCRPRARAWLPCHLDEHAIVRFYRTQERLTLHARTLLAWFGACFLAWGLRTFASAATPETRRPPEKVALEGASAANAVARQRPLRRMSQVAPGLSQKCDTNQT